MLCTERCGRSGECKGLLSTAQKEQHRCIHKCLYRHVPTCHNQPSEANECHSLPAHPAVCHQHRQLHYRRHYRYHCERLER